MARPAPRSAADSPVGCTETNPRSLIIAAVTAVAVVATGGVGSALAQNGHATARGTTATQTLNGKPSACILVRGAKCAGANLRGRAVNHGDLRKVDLRRANLAYCDLRVANLAGADLRSANLRYCDLRGANLRGATFQYGYPVHGFGMKAGGTAPPAAPSCDPRCSSADLIGADLADANLRGANLRGANLRGANLAGANLSGASMRFANLTGAVLIRADLTGVDVTGADVTDVVNHIGVCPAGYWWSDVAERCCSETGTGCAG